MSCKDFKIVKSSLEPAKRGNQIWEKEGISRQAAILRAAPQRLRPILMTTITTVLGMFPLALGIGQGSELLQPTFRSSEQKKR